MSNIPPMSSNAYTRYSAPVSSTTPAGPNAGQVNSAEGYSRGSDAVELSVHAQMMNKLRELPDVRQDVIDRVQSQIADGSYETDDKINQAVDGLLGDL